MFWGMGCVTGKAGVLLRLGEHSKQAALLSLWGLGWVTGEVEVLLRLGERSKQTASLSLWGLGWMYDWVGSHLREGWKGRCHMWENSRIGWRVFWVFAFGMEYGRAEGDWLVSG